MNKKILMIILVLLLTIISGNLAFSQMFIVNTEFTFYGGIMTYNYVPTSTKTDNFDMCLDAGIDVYYLFNQNFGMNFGVYWDGFGGHGDWASNDIEENVNLSLVYNGLKFTGGISLPIFTGSIIMFDINAFSTLYFNPYYELDYTEYTYEGVYLDLGIRLKANFMLTLIVENHFALFFPAAFIFEMGFLDIDPNPNAEIRKLYIGVSFGLAFSFY